MPPSADATQHGEKPCSARREGDNVDRREFLKAAAFTTAGAVAGPALLERVGSMLASPALAAAGGTTFGCSAQAYAGKSREQLIAYLEDLAGGPFDTVHNRFSWQTSLVNGYSKWIVETGHTPILSWSTRSTSGDVPWRAIAAGSHDARIRAEARAIADVGWETFFCFHKEPEDEPSLGDAGEWRAAHDRVYELFQQEGATNVTFVAALMASTFNGRNGGADAWLPARYDAIGVDGYNRNARGDWRSFGSIFTPALQVARQRSAPLFVIEMGCVEGVEGAKGDWMREAASVAASWPELIGVSYNHEAGATNNDAGMNYRIDTSTSAVQGFRDMVSHAAFGEGTGGGDTGGDGGTDGGSGDGDPTCEEVTARLERRTARMRELRARLDRQRRRLRRLKRRSD